MLSAVDAPYDVLNLLLEYISLRTEDPDRLLLFFRFGFKIAFVMIQVSFDLHAIYALRPLLALMEAERPLLMLSRYLK